MQTAKRPVHLNLFQIRLPIAGVMSILHRLCGVLLFLFLPAFSWLLHASIADAETWRGIVAWLATPFGRVFLILSMWALLHHLLAGIRYLLLDLDLGVDRPAYRLTAWAVVLAAPLLALLVGVLL